MSNTRRAAAVLASVAALAMVPRASLAQKPATSAPKADADAHFKRGVDLHKENDFSGALVEFRRAYEINPRFQVLYNIAECYYQLQDYARALRTFQQYMLEGGDKISAARRAAVTKELDKLKGRVARLEITTSEPGVAIAIDDQPVGTTPLDEAVLVSAGRRRVTATPKGRAPVTEIVEIAGGDMKTVNMSVAKTEEPKQAPVPPPPARGFPLVPWIVTGVLGAGWAVMGLVSLGASNDLDTKLGTFGVKPEEITSARSKTAAFALTTDILFGAALVGAGVSTYLTVTRDTPRPPAGPRKAADVRFVVGPGDVRLVGTF